MTPEEALATALRRAWPVKRRVLPNERLAAATILAGLPEGWRLVSPESASSGRERDDRGAADEQTLRFRGALEGLLEAVLDEHESGRPDRARMAAALREARRLLAHTDAES